MSIVSFQYWIEYQLSNYLFSVQLSIQLLIINFTYYKLGYQLLIQIQINLYQLTDYQFSHWWIKYGHSYQSSDQLLNRSPITHIQNQLINY